MKSLVASSIKALRKLAASAGNSPSALIERIRVIGRREGIPGLVNRGLLLLYMSGFKPPRSASWLKLYRSSSADAAASSPCRVSIIVPCYNHAPYLAKRLDTIYGQDYSNFEVILLDDCSTDDSRDILTSYQQRFAAITQCHFNTVNSGGVFHQWAKGLELATGELIWIAESDDFSSPNFLSELVRDFRNPAVMIAFCRTLFVSGEQERVVWRSEHYLRDLRLRIWRRRFTVSAHSLTRYAWATKNVIPNVSAAVFRHPRDLSLLQDPAWQSMRLCGDWVFYLALARGGLVAYSPNAINYYRQHELNTSVNAQREQIYYREHYLVRDYLSMLYRLTPAELDRQRKHVYRHWCVRQGLGRMKEFQELYKPSLQPRPIADGRLLNIAVVTYALVGGGGETLPLMLANLLHRRGHAVTVIDLNQMPAEPGVRRMLNPAIPLLTIEKTRYLIGILNDMAIDVVSSHHAWVDMAVAALIARTSSIKQVVTLHGMYEMMTPELFGSLASNLNRVDAFVYTADKNLLPFSADFLASKPFRRIENAVTALHYTPASRGELGIQPEDFVLCMVARGIPDKGWQEAIEAVQLANHDSPRSIHLLLIGDGEEPERLRLLHDHDRRLHFLGFQSQIRSFYACSDMGFIPSRFQGESFPLVLIDSLMTGRPVLASAIGEIPAMLQTPEGPAGVLFELDDWQIPVAELSRLIHDLANDNQRYRELSARVPLAASRFDPERMADAYEDVLRQVCASAA